MTEAILNRTERPAGLARVVALTEQDLEDAARLLKTLTQASEIAFVSHRLPGAAARIITRESLIEAARRELSNRRSRAHFFGEGMFGEAAWEILLKLYVERQGRRLKIGELAKQLRLAVTSAIRWINYLDDRHLVRRTAHPTDQRAVYVEITPNAIDALDTYFSETLSQTG